jgi:hypothetical protein
MASKASQQAVPAKMYRHFAAITLAVTAGLAIATSDDTPTAEPPAREPAKAAPKAYGEAKLVRRTSPTDQPVASGWGPDETYQEPPEAGLSFGAGFVTTPGEAAGGTGLTPEQLARLSPEERERLLRQQTAPQVSEAERRAQARRISEASLRRSGGSE